MLQNLFHKHGIMLCVTLCIQCGQTSLPRIANPYHCHSLYDNYNLSDGLSRRCTVHGTDRADADVNFSSELQQREQWLTNFRMA